MGRPEIWNGGDNTPTTTDTQRVLLIKLIKTEIDNGGGGGTEQEIYPGHYGGVTPVIIPLVAHAMAYDLDFPFPTWKWDPDTSTWT